MKVALINPPLVSYAGDLFGGIPSIPVGLLYVAAAVRAAGHEVSVLDAFTLAPHSRHRWLDDFQLHGLLPEELTRHVPVDAECVAVSAHSGGAHRYSLKLLDHLKRNKNLHTVVGGPFASSLPGAFLDEGIDFVIVGEGEQAFPALLDRLERGDGQPGKIDGVATAGRRSIAPVVVDDLNSLQPPAYDLIDYSVYQSCGRSHGPFRGTYFPLITSRGCPCNCAFCATPWLSGRKWRPRSPEHVVEEIASLVEDHGVTDFQIQDDNFTTSRHRVVEIAQGLARLPRPVTFSLPSAVRANDLSEQLIDEMVDAGLRYIAFAPESGSARVRQLMNKDVDIARLRRLVCHSASIRLPAQVCFVAGFPGETATDRSQTLEMIRDLTIAGAEDMSLFIMAPVPGSQSAGTLGSIPCYEGLNWSPKWREDYEELARFRRRCYFAFFAGKATRHPLRLASSLTGVVTGRYRTKGEMVIGSMLRDRSVFR